MKHKLPDAKPNMRIDRLVNVLLALSEEVEEDRNIMMKRGLMSGRYRLGQQRIQHEQSTRWFRGRQSDVRMIADGIWQVVGGGAVHKLYAVLRHNMINMAKFPDSAVEAHL
ncbi:unnamed protein product [Heligmosomoides polygyrus]|uniref:Uncharacterized protein n=1 Tax=Heligmosomoides polygyrus TaxID=6339 RepID=A0A183GRV4_HELPZ|nr:unnamed protein product [Heligmosomoides polygyrus]